MATIPIFSAGSAPSNITSGGGAAQVTQDVINAMWNNAQGKSQAAVENAIAVVKIMDPAPQMAPVRLDTSYTAPLPPQFPSMDPNNGQAIYDTEVAAILNQIEGSFRDYIAEFFPETAAQYFDDAMAWCHRAMTNGGTGINVAQEQALWQRGRARILADSQRAEEEAMMGWANRRFPMPPGALTSQIHEIRLDAGRKLAEQSRDISIKSFETEVENVRFAVKLVIDQRQIALQSAGDYIRTIMLGPDTAMKLATGLSGLQNDFYRNLTAYYSAQTAALEPKVRLAIADADLQMRGQSANLQALVTSMDAKAKAGLAAAQMLGQQAASGINAIGARASISGNDSSSV